MAKIVLGLGSSHSPVINMEPAAWLVRGEHDKTGLPLFDFSGNEASYEEILANARPSMADEITMEKLEQRHKANQAGVKKISDALYAANPDVLVMFGDDHWEVFKDDIMPPLAVYWGETIPYEPSGIMKWPYDPGLKSDLWYWEEKKQFPIATELAHHLITSLTEQEYDVAHSKRYRDGQGMSHSYAFVYSRIMTGKIIPTVPIHLNTYFPPNQPTPRRCYKIGQAVRRAVESWESDARVVVLGSGGLSHFVVDEELDRMFLDVMNSKDIEQHAALPREKLNSGNSELRNWTAVAGAVEHLDMELFDYVPCYRSLAGTGCAMAFAQWT